MQSPPPSHDALHAALIEGITSDPPWGAFTARMREMFTAVHANVIFRKPTSNQIFYVHSSSPEVERFGDLTKLYDLDKDPIPYFAMQAFRAYQVEDFVGDGTLDSHPFINDFLRPLGMERLLICRVKAPAGLQAWLSVSRSRDNVYSESDRANLVAISRLFSAALTVFGRLKGAEDDRDAYARVVHARAAGMARLDEGGQVLHADAKAKVWLEEARIVQIAHGRLCAMDPGDEAQLSAATARILSGKSDEELVVLGAALGETLEILFFSVSEPFEPAWTHAPRVLAYMCMNGREALPSPQRLRAKFGLTRREAALAALLARGLTLGQAAQNLGISEQTARAYLRQVFQKAGVSRQSELVRLVHGSIGGI